MLGVNQGATSEISMLLANRSKCKPSASNAHTTNAPPPKADPKTLALRAALNRHEAHVLADPVSTRHLADYVWHLEHAMLRAHRAFVGSRKGKRD
jgi:hypothetical protein